MARGKKGNYIGVRSGRLVVVGEMKAPRESKNKDIRVLCKCDCGREKTFRGSHVINGLVKSCGCLNAEIGAKRFFRHGMYGTRIYRIFRGIKNRCLNKNLPQYKNYGGRGIVICDEWKNDFMAFYTWAMANGYKDTLTIDRIDSDGNYEPSNCRWADRKTQGRNTKRNRLLYYNGKTYCASKWAEILGLNYNTLINHLHRGMSVKDALEYNKGDKNVQDTKEKSN